MIDEPTCGRCQRPSHEHPSGNCPDGGGTYTFVISDETARWVRDNMGVPKDQLVARYIAHVRRQRAAVDQDLQPQTRREPLIVEVPTVLTRIDAQLRADNAAAGSSKALQESLVEQGQESLVEGQGQGKRMHDLGAAGAGDLGPVPTGVVLGACPSCGADLRICDAVNPRSGRIERALQHPVPFCSYFGETDPAVIEREIARRQS